MIEYELKKHQKEGIKHLIRHNYTILADAMGLGKTLQAIELIKRTGKKALVVCPASLRLTWASEVKKFSNLKPVIFMKDSSSDAWDIAIISYASVKKCKTLWKKASTVVGDEWHYLKNLEAARTQAFHHLVLDHPPERLVGLTGTAIKNRVPEFFSLLALCSLNPYNTSGESILKKYPTYYSFAAHFSNRVEFRVKGRTVVKYEGHRNVPELKQFMQGKYLRRKASEVLDLPPIIRKDIIVNDDEIDYELLHELEENAKAFATFKVNNAKLKTKYTADYVKDLVEAGEGPILVFTDHVLPAESIASKLPKRYKIRLITGATPMKKRDEYKEFFQEKRIDVLVATIGSMSTGHTLTAASNIVFNDLSFVPGDIAQAEKRIHRIGQEKTCIIHRIFWGQMDAYLAKQLDKKIATMKEIL